MLGHMSHPRYGDIPYQAPAPTRSIRQAPARAGSNERIATNLAASVEAFDFDPDAIAGVLVTLDPAHQERIARLMTATIAAWARMPADDWGNRHPLYRVWKQAQAMNRARKAVRI